MTHQTEHYHTTKPVSPFLYGIFGIALAFGIADLFVGSIIHGLCSVVLATAGTMVTGWRDTGTNWAPTRRSRVVVTFLAFAIFALGVTLMVTTGSLVAVIYPLCGVLLFFEAHAAKPTH